ncbi:hypothetical protein ACPA9J_29710 [Pseudomonas aeruginosa]
MLQADSQGRHPADHPFPEWGESARCPKAGEHDLSLLGWAGDNGDPTTSSA